MKYVIYLRVSTKEQDLRTQEQKCLKWLKENGGENSEFRLFYDSITSKKPLEKRKGIMEALNALETGDVLVGQKVDRLARNEGEAHTIRSFLERNKIGIAMIDQPGVDDPFIFSIFSAVAAQEVKLIRERIKDKLDAKKERGERTGMVPYGYSLDPIKLVEVNGKDKKKVLKHGVLVPESHEQSGISLMCQLFDEGKSLRHIAKILTDQGYKNRAENPFQPMSIARSLARTGRTSLKDQSQEEKGSLWSRSR